MASQLKIDQSGLSAGLAGVSRTDGKDDGSLVTLTNTGSGATTRFRILDAPLGDVDAVATLAPTGDSKIWTFTPTTGKHGTFLIELVEDLGQPTEKTERRIFGVRLPSSGLLIPALNEHASPSASLANAGPAQIEASDNNALDYSTHPDLNDRRYSGWWRSIYELFTQADAALAGTFTGLADTPGAYPAAGLVALRVNAARNAVEFSTVKLGDEGIILPANPTEPTETDGMIWYDSSIRAFVGDTGLPGHRQTFGREITTLARNVTGSLIPDGTAVYVNDAQGNNPTIELADNTSETKSRMLGITTHDIANNSTGAVTVLGPMSFDTSGLVEGQLVYLSSTPGEVTATKPPATEIVKIVGVALNSTNNGLLFVFPEPAQLPFISQTKIYNIKSFGAVGDGVADDTVSVHAALLFAETYGVQIYVPVGTYRVTSGYTTTVVFGSIELVGEMSDYEANAGRAGKRSKFVLDSISGASFFLDVATRGRYSFINTAYQCAQEVTDRSFFKITTPGAYALLGWDRCHFQAVEHPIHLVDGMYAQHMSIRDTLFRDSGMIRSDGTTLKVTGLTLDNVAHEGSTPDATTKTLLDLRGVRQIDGGVVICEGSLPSANDWTVLDLGDDYPNFSRTPLGGIRCFWSEWTGNQPQYIARQNAGRFHLNMGRGLPATGVFRAENLAAMHLETTTDDRDLDDAISVDGGGARVFVEALTTRNTDAFFRRPESSPFVSYARGISQRSGGAGEEVFGAAHADDSAPAIVWAFNGGYPDGALAQFQGFGGTTYQPSSDATHGRKLIVGVPSPASGLNLHMRFPVRNTATPGETYTLLIHGKTPQYTSGSIRVSSLQDSADAGTATNLASDTEFRVAIPMSVLSATSITFGAFIYGPALDGVTGDLELYSIAVVQGNSHPRRWFPNYPATIVTASSAAPTVGTWVRGDVVRNTVAGVGLPVGWICTVAGSPGTWEPLSIAGSPTFLRNADTPSSYSGQAGRVARVNSGETGLEFAASQLGDTSVTFSNGVQILTGTGSPEGAVSASVGTIYQRSNGSQSTVLAVKETGGASTGWGRIVSGPLAVENPSARTVDYAVMTKQWTAYLNTNGVGTWNVPAIFGGFSVTTGDHLLVEATVLLRSAGTINASVAEKVLFVWRWTGAGFEVIDTGSWLSPQSGTILAVAILSGSNQPQVTVQRSGGATDPAAWFVDARVAYMRNS